MKNSLFKNSFIFVFGEVLNKSIPFFMLPVLTRYLTPSDYGIIAMFTVFVSILAVFIGLNVVGSINVNFFIFSKDKLREYISNIMIILVSSTVFIYTLIVLFSDFISNLVNLSFSWIFVALILALAQFLTVINMLLWTAEQKPKEYIIYQLSQTIIVTILTLIFVVGLSLGWEGHLIAMSIGTGMFALISFSFIIRRGYFKFKYNKKHIKEALHFGIPLIPHSLSGWIMSGADRMILMSILGSTATGIYAISYQLGMIINVLVTAFHKAWNPYLFRILSSNPTHQIKQKLVKFTYLYFILIILFTIIFSYIMTLIIPYFLGDKFYNANDYLIYFALAFSFNGMYFMVVDYIFYTKRTYILAYITFFTSLLHIGILYFMVHYYGILGVAQTTLISYFITFLLTWWFSIKTYSMPWNIWRKND